MRFVDTRRWIYTGVCGALIIACLAPLWDVWLVNAAGVLVNRVVVQGTSGEAGAKGDLEQATDLMDRAAARGPHTPSREIPIWRTYGAAATFIPSDQAYELLLRARNAGRVDRIGELWLGEIAAATEHWEEASKAYRRIDASNLLIHRAEVSLEAGDKDLAVRQFLLAKESLDAALERAVARTLLLDRMGNQPSAGERLMQQSAERVTSLFRIGRGILNAGHPLQAIPILEEGMQASQTDSPGTVVQQSLMLSLATALAKTLPAPPKVQQITEPSYYAYDTDEGMRISSIIRIRELVFKGTKLGLTASVCVQAGRIMLLAGEDGQAFQFLYKAIDLDPHLAEAYLVLGNHYESLGMTVMARQIYGKGVEQLPANPELAGAHAISSYRTLPAADALPLLEHASNMDTRDPYVFAILGDCYMDLGKVAEARATLEEGLHRFPGAEAIVNRLKALGDAG